MYLSTLLIYLRELFSISQIWEKKGEIMPVKTVTSRPLPAPHRKWRFARLHAVCEMKMGYVKQDTWHVLKRIFWYMHLYHALLSKQTCG